jgi:periplasmic divalent cation tolerance protein
VITTLGSADAGAAFVRTLVERRLVACGTLLDGARSIYRWQGAVSDDREVLVLLKTTADRQSDLRAAFEELHPYEVPEFLAVAPDGVSPRYLDWLRASTARGET